jgi:hypothetical protein
VFGELQSLGLAHAAFPGYRLGPACAALAAC